MFSDGSYTKAATGTGYKKISFNGMTEQFISKIWYHLLINNWVLNVILAGILLFLIIKRGKKNESLCVRSMRGFCRISYCGN